MGSMIEFPGFYEHMSGKDNLYMPQSVEKALELLGLLEAAQKPLKSYSLGMKQRLGIARAILCKSELLVLDEPTNGLDPSGMKQLRDLFKMLCTEYGITIILSSHLLPEVESIADTIGIIHRGRMKAEISMKEISGKNTAYIGLTVEDTKKAAYILADMLELDHFEVMDQNSIRIYDAGIDTKEIAKALALNGAEIVSIGKKTESLEDYFIKLTGGGTGSC